jgi:hypothetical protein
LYECQKKGFTKFAFRKLLILKDAILAVLDKQMAAGKEKAGEGLPHTKRSFICNQLYHRLRKSQETVSRIFDAAAADKTHCREA